MDARRAFSLVELILALGLFALSLSALLAVCTASLKVTRKGSTLSAGSLVARDVLQQQIYKVLWDTPAGARASFLSVGHDVGGTPWAQGNVTVGNTEYRYQMYSHPIDTTDPNNRFVQCLVVVNWWGQGDHAGYGKLEARASRCVSENERP